MAGPIISAFGKRSLFATFLTPKTFLFRPFIVSSATTDLSQVRHSSESRVLLERIAKRQLVSPYKKAFHDQLRRAGVETQAVEERRLLTSGVLGLKETIEKAINNIPTTSSDDSFHLGPVKRLKTEDALLHAIVPVLFPGANKSTRFQTGVNEPWEDQLPLCPELSGCIEDSRQLTKVIPDRCTGFVLSPWADKYGLATSFLGKMMSPAEDVAFDFFNVEGKRRRGQEIVAVRQNMSSMSLALHNIAYLHDKVMALANDELKSDPGHHVSTYLSNYPSVQTYNLNASVHLIGASDESVTLPGSIVSQFAPYTNFDDEVIVLSVMITISQVQLNCHWRTSTPLPARDGVKQITNGPSYHYHKLMSWKIEYGLEQAKIAIDTAIEHVANALEGRLNTYMRILEDHLSKSNGVQIAKEPGIVRRDDLVWM